MQRVSEGVYGILPETLRRREAEALHHSGGLELLTAVEAVLKLARFTPAAVARDLHDWDRTRLSGGPGSLKECIRLLQEILVAIQVGETISEEMGR